MGRKWSEGFLTHEIINKKLSGCGQFIYLIDFCTVICSNFLDAIASPITYPCQSMSGSVIDRFRLEIALASLGFASLFYKLQFPRKCSEDAFLNPDSAG